MEDKIVYFEKPGKENTADVLNLVKERAKARGIRTIVLASTRGNMAKAALEAFQDLDIKLVVVPWQHGFNKGENPFPKDLVEKIRSKGHQVHFGTMLFHTEAFYGNQTSGVMANLLRIFSQGIKVCVEIILMATDGGCLAVGEKIIAIAGSGSGADTAVIATAAASTQMTGLRIHEIICKPL